MAAHVKTTTRFTNGEVITLTVTMGLMVLVSLEKNLPKGSRNARKLKSLREAILDVVKGSGEKVDREVSAFWCSQWDKAAELLEREYRDADENVISVTIRLRPETVAVCRALAGEEGESLEEGLSQMVEELVERFLDRGAGEEADDGAREQRGEGTDTDGTEPEGPGAEVSGGCRKGGAEL